MKTIQQSSGDGKPRADDAAIETAFIHGLIERETGARPSDETRERREAWLRDHPPSSVKKDSDLFVSFLLILALVGWGLAAFIFASAVLGK